MSCKKFFDWVVAIDTGNYSKVLMSDIEDFKENTVFGHFVGLDGPDMDNLSTLFEMIMIRYAQNRGKTRKELEQEINLAMLAASGRGL